MTTPAKDIDEFIGSILRGAAKILSCSSANLILLNNTARDVRVLVGTFGEGNTRLSEVESVFGSAVQQIVFPLKNIERSLVFSSWRDMAVYETSNFNEVVAGVFPQNTVSQVSKMIDDQRFICVPVVRGRRAIGVIIFTKDGLAPFGLQQREILLRYAQRIGEIIENDLKSRGSAVSREALDVSLRSKSRYILFDAKGAISGVTYEPGFLKECSDSNSRPTEYRDTIQHLEKDVVDQLAELAKRYHASSKETPEVVRIELPVENSANGLSIRSSQRVELSKMQINGEPSILCSISDQKPKSETSIKNQLLYFALGDTAPAFLVDPELKITSCNEATSQILGYSNDEMLHLPIQTLFDDSTDIRTILDHQFLFFSDGYFEDVSLVRHKDGRIIPSRVQALLLANESNQVIGFLILVRDQTAQIEASGTENNGHELMRRDRLATMGEIAAQLAHEIRNPIVSIGSTLELLSKDPTSDSDRSKTMLELHREVTRIDKILRDYLSLAARRNAKVYDVQLSSIIEDATRLIKGARGVEGYTIVSAVGEGIDVFADYIGLRQVFVNLLRNAVDASPYGGTVSCSVVQTDRNVVVQIDDQGPGLSISPSECFRPFFTTKKNGTGLGLTVCQKIVESHGGIISLKNLEQGGCRVSVVLRRKGAT